MLSESEIRKIARRERIPAGTAEKDYVLTKFLYFLSNSDLKLAFKGGTAIKKIYLKTGRFSQDLDFTVLEKNNFEEEIRKILEKVGMKMEIKDFSKLRLSQSFKISFIGPLKHKNSFDLDLSMREKPELKPIKKEVFHFYPDIPSFKVKVLKLVEILAEKLRATYTRGSSRDILDIYFLSELKIDKKLLKRLFIKKLKNVGVKKVKEERFKEEVKDFKLSDIIYLLPSTSRVEKEEVSKKVVKEYSFLFN